MFYNYKMSSVSDHIQLMKSQENKYDSVFNKREWLYINDTTTQYDQGTSIIETTSLSNNSKFLDYNSGYLSVPLLAWEQCLFLLGCMWRSNCGEHFCWRPSLAVE